jgi:hypothetical protein
MVSMVDPLANGLKNAPYAFPADISDTLELPISNSAVADRLFEISGIDATGDLRILFRRADLSACGALRVKHLPLK